MPLLLCYRQTLVLFLVQLCLNAAATNAAHRYHRAAVGDPGMRREDLRVAFEAWNQCNEVGIRQAPGIGSPRAADCFHLSPKNGSIIHRVSRADNRLGVGTPFPGLPSRALHNPDLYAVEKELYLGSLCQEEGDDHGKPWQFWMVMLKNGNYDTMSGLCPENGRKKPPFSQPGMFPCFGEGCMNQPFLQHQPTAVLTDSEGTKTSMRGSFSGTYDSPPPFPFPAGGPGGSDSYFEVVWEKKIGAHNNTSTGWFFRHKLKTSERYPWLMLYLRADATKGFSGGYHYDTRGMLHTMISHQSLLISR